MYNSKNIDSLAGRSFDLLVCAGAPAEKWKANRDPEADRQNLDRLWNALRQAAAGKVVLLSTVDVYARPIEVNEDDDVDAPNATAYGRHRFELERRMSDHFDTLVIRLPGLFGPGLKKNAIYDLIHDNEVHKIDHRASYQFYDVSRLWEDIDVALASGLRLLNLATEPTTMAEVARKGFGIDLTHEPAQSPARYDFRSKYAGIFESSNDYLISKEDVLRSLRAFVESERRREADRRCA
ncbi:hypothetical protein BH23PLA1_BH23PLA1_12690 [soil metagenome]